MIGGRRQRGSLGCRAEVMAAVQRSARAALGRSGLVSMVAACTLSSSAGLAAPGLRLVLPAEAPVAPARVEVRASATATDPIIDYDWGPLDVAPRCRASSCSVSLPVAACVTLHVAVTTDLGETATATAAACATDGAGAPPIAELVVVEAAERVEITPSWREGSDPIVSARMWVGAEREVITPPRVVVLERDGGCHAVDLLVADGRGRIGLDRRTVCTGEAGPRPWLGAREGAITPASSGLVLCAEVDHPLGLEVEQISGEVPLEGCAPPVAPPPELERRTLVVFDQEGLVSTASLLVARAPDSGAPTLVFATLGQHGRPIAGGPLEVPLAVHGGEAPFSVEATLQLSGGVTATVAAAARAEGVFSLVSQRLPGSGTAQLRVTVVDGRGLAASAATELEIVDQAAAEPSASVKLGCTTSGTAAPRALGQREALTWLLGALCLILRPRRRG